MNRAIAIRLKTEAQITARQLENILKEMLPIHNEAELREYQEIAGIVQRLRAIESRYFI